MPSFYDKSVYSFLPRPGAKKSRNIRLSFPAAYSADTVFRRPPADPVSRETSFLCRLFPLKPFIFHIACRYLCHCPLKICLFRFSCPFRHAGQFCQRHRCDHQHTQYLFPHHLPPDAVNLRRSIPPPVHNSNIYYLYSNIKFYSGQSFFSTKRQKSIRICSRCPYSISITNIYYFISNIYIIFGE